MRTMVIEADTVMIIILHFKVSDFSFSFLSFSSKSFRFEFEGEEGEDEGEEKGSMLKAGEVELE